MNVLPIIRVPSDPADKILALERNVETLWNVVQELQLSILSPIKREPGKLREGMVRYADGTNWDPGSGAGLYQYLSSTWVKL